MFLKTYFNIEYRTLNTDLRFILRHSLIDIRYSFFLKFPLFPLFPLFPYFLIPINYPLLFKVNKVISPKLLNLTGIPETPQPGLV